MIRDLKFCNFDVRKSDFDSKDGEIIVPTNLCQNYDGTFGAGIKAIRLAQLPENLEAVAIHDAGNKRNVIAKQIIAGGMTAIFSAEMKDAIHPKDLEWICNVESIRCVEMYANIIVMATDRGLRYLVWDGKRYSCVNLQEAFPTIEFGLIKTGSLTCTETFVITGMSENSENSGASGSGASRPHPSAESERETFSATFKGIAKAYTDAIDEQVVTKGYFHQPFFIRYALRMEDGTHILPSAPILMLPTVLPPCLGLSTATDAEGKYMITTDFSSVNYFQLAYKMASGVPEEIKTMISAIDIFVSPEIPTFDKERLNDGYITTYSKVIGARNTLTNRGERSISRADGMIFEGHYSDGNNIFTAQYINQDTINRKTFMTHPNLSFHQQISTTADFYKIASIPYSATDGFKKLEIMTSDFGILEKGFRLRDLPLSHCRIKATALLAQGNALLAATEGIMLPPPFPIKSPGHSHHASGHDVTELSISVYTLIGGEIQRISSVCSSEATLSESIPRYVSYPDRRAFLMTFSDGNTIYALPLTPHEKQQASFWTGGTEANYLPVPVQETSLPQIDSDTETTDTRCTLLISDTGNVVAFDMASSTAFTQSTITALCPATKAPKSGVFGRHNLYAFTKGGIWMLEYQSGRVNSFHKISPLQCHNNLSIADTGQKVYFASNEGIHAADGSEIESLSGPLESLRPNILKLPHAQELLEVAEMTSEENVTEQFFDGCGLIHSSETGTIAVFNPQKDYSLLYSQENKSWTIADISISGKIKVPAGSRAIGTYRNTISHILRSDRERDETNTFLITRPIKLTPTIASHTIHRIEILGYFGCGDVRMAVYGTDNLRDWHLIGSSHCHHLENFNVTCHRMIIICVAARLSADDYLYGVRINADD